MKFSVRAPATSANLGPGFDALGLALDLWNETAFEILPADAGQEISISGHGAGILPSGPENLVLGAFIQAFSDAGQPAPGLRAAAQNGIPISSGLGSSAAAIVTGVLAAAAVLGHALSPERQLALASRLEGHPDNAAAALFGGLTVSALEGDEVLFDHITPAAGWQVGIVLPAVRVSTRAMRAALPESLPRADAVFNISRALLVVRALEKGDEALLRQAMADRVHQSYRLPHIRGGSEALAAAHSAGAAAAISGAGPGLIVVSREVERLERACRATEAAFAGVNVETWDWKGAISEQGAAIL